MTWSPKKSVQSKICFTSSSSRSPSSSHTKSLQGHFDDYLLIWLARLEWESIFARRPESWWEPSILQWILAGALIKNPLRHAPRTLLQSNNIYYSSFIHCRILHWMTYQKAFCSIISSIKMPFYKLSSHGWPCGPVSKRVNEPSNPFTNTFCSSIAYWTGWFFFKKYWEPLQINWWQSSFLAKLFSKRLAANDKNCKIRATNLHWNCKRGTINTYLYFCQSWMQFKKILSTVLIYK